MDPLASLILTAVLAFVTAGATIIAANKSGLTDIQRRNREEGAALVTKLQARLEVVIAENKDLEERVKELEVENTALRKRVEQLEGVVADRAIAGGRRDVR